jgi:trk system potassium uptake protein TrkA
VIAKAMGDTHGKILLKVGADEVVYPEKDMAIRLANRLTFSNLLDFIELSPEYSLAEEKAPSRFIGKTVTELNSRQEAGLSIVAIKHNDHIMIGPTGNHRIESGDALVIIGETAKVNAFIKD